MNRRGEWLPWLLAACVLAATGMALLDPGQDGTAVALATVRGDTAFFRGSGLYRFDPVAVAREALLWDLVNAFVGLPVLAIAAVASRRGSTRGRVVLAGVALYFTYTYLMYATMSAFNPAFPCYVVAMATGVLTVAHAVSGLDAEEVRRRRTLRFPRRLLTAYLGTTAALLLALWSMRVAQVLRAGRLPDALAGMATMETQAIDLGLVVPFLGAAALLLHRDHPWGYVLSGVALAFGALLDLAIPAWVVADLLADGNVQVGEAIPFLVLSVVGAAMLVAYLRQMRDRLPTPYAPAGR